MPHSPSSPHTIQYTLLTTLAALSVFYIFGPSLLRDPNPSPSQTKSKRPGAVGLSNQANDCFINSVLQLLAGSVRLRRYLETAVRFERREEGEGKAGSGSDVKAGVAATQHSADDSDKTRGDDQHDDKEKENKSQLLSSSSNREDSPTTKENHKPVTAALYALLTRLHTPLNSGRTISARPFILALETAFGRRISRAQQDAHEFLQVVAERLGEEAEGVEAKPDSKPEQGTRGPGSESAARREGEKRESEEKSEHEKDEIDSDQNDNEEEEEEAFPLKGTLTSTTTCQTCTHAPPPHTTPFTILTLPVPQQPKSTSTSTLATCLDALLLRETIPDYTCEGCGNRTSISRDTAITRYPEVLALHFGRSMYGAYSGVVKNVAKVEFGEVLRLGTLAERTQGRGVRYRLVGVVTHRGGHESGHYETFRRWEGPTAEEERSADDDAPFLDGRANSESTEADDADDLAKTRGKAKQQQKQSRSRKKEKDNDRWHGVSDANVSACRTSDVLGKQKEVYILLYEKEEWRSG